MSMAPSEKSFMVFFGSEEYHLDRVVSDFRQKDNLEVLFFDGDSVDSDTVLSLCESPSLGQKRMVIVDNADKTKNDEALIQFISNVDLKDLGTVLVAVVRSDKLSGWPKVCASKGKATKYDKPKPWETAKQITNIQSEASRIGIKLEKGVAELLLKVLGYDLRAITNEMNKAAYLGKSVSRETVQSLIPYVFPVQPWDVANAAVKGNVKKALFTLGLVYRNLGEGASIPVSYALMSLVEKLFLARSLHDRGASEEDIAARLGMHPYAYRINLRPVVSRYDLPRLADQMKMLCKLDSTVKGSANSKRTHVELAVLSLAN